MLLCENVCFCEGKSRRLHSRSLPVSAGINARPESGNSLTSAWRIWNTLVLEIMLSFASEADLTTEIPKHHNFILCSQNWALMSWLLKQQQCKACSGVLSKADHRWLSERAELSNFLEAWQKWVCGEGEDLNPNWGRCFSKSLILNLQTGLWQMPSHGYLLNYGFNWKWVAGSWTYLGMWFMDRGAEVQTKSSFKNRAWSVRGKSRNMEFDTMKIAERLK